MNDLPNPNMTVRGDMTVGRNVTVGGNQIVRGNMTVEHGLNVKGWVSIENLNFPAVGIFDSDDALIAAVTPKPGYIAGVITASQGLDYTVELYKVSDGAWTATGITLPVRVTISATTNIEGIDAEEFAEWQQQVNDTLDEKADAEYLTVTPGTGVTTIQLKNGVSATVLTQHQSITGKTDKVSGIGHNGKLASLDSNGNLDDSGKKVTLLDLLGVQAGYFKGILPSGATVDSSARLSDVEPEDYCKLVYWDNGNNQRFVCYGSTAGKYYTQWGKDGEEAYMDGDKIRKNKLYVDENGTVYYCDGNNNLKVVEALDSSKASKLPMSGGDAATEDNFVAIGANGNIKDSGHKHSDYLTQHQNITGKADKSELTVETASGLITINLKGSGAGATKAVVYTPARVNELLGRAVGEAVRCTFQLAVGENTLSTSENVLLAVINGVGILPEDGKVIVSAESAEEVVVSFVFKEATTIPTYAFGNESEENTILKTVHIPSFVHKIDVGAFRNCTTLKSIDCEAITPPEIESYAFDGVDMGEATLTVHGVVKTLYDDGNTKWGGVGTVENFNS